MVLAYSRKVWVQTSYNKPRNATIAWFTRSRSIYQRAFKEDSSIAQTIAHALHGASNRYILILFFLRQGTHLAQTEREKSRFYFQLTFYRTAISFLYPMPQFCRQTLYTSKGLYWGSVLSCMYEHALSHLFVYISIGLKREYIIMYIW